MLRYCFSFVAIFSFILLSFYQFSLAEVADELTLTQEISFESKSSAPSITTETESIVDKEMTNPLVNDLTSTTEPLVSTSATDSLALESEPQAMVQASEIPSEGLEQPKEELINSPKDNNEMENSNLREADESDFAENDKSPEVNHVASNPTLVKTAHLETPDAEKQVTETKSNVANQEHLSSGDESSLFRPSREGEKIEGRAAKTLDFEIIENPSLNPIIENEQIVNSQLRKTNPFFKIAKPIDENSSTSSLARQAEMPEKDIPITSRSSELEPLTRALPVDEPVNAPSSTELIKALLEPPRSRRAKRKTDLSLTTNSHSQASLLKQTSTEKSPSSKSVLSSVSQFRAAPQASLPSSNSILAEPNSIKATLEKKEPNESLISSLKPSAPPVGPSRSSTPLIKPERPVSASKKFRLNQITENKDTQEEVDPSTILSHTISSAKGTSLLKSVKSTMVLQNLRVPEIRTKSAEELALFQQRHPNVCGNGICEEGETCESCRKDCGVVTLGQLVVCEYAVQRCRPELGKAVVLLGITENKSKFMTPDTLPASIATRYPIHRSDSNRPIGILPRFEPPTHPQETLKHTGLTSFVFASHMREMPNTVNWFVNQGYQIVSATKCKLGYDGPFLKFKDAFHWDLPQDE